MTEPQTLRSLSQALATGAVSSRLLVEQSLTQIADAAGEGARAFLVVNSESALTEADRQDGLNRPGIAGGRLI